MSNHIYEYPYFIVVYNTLWVLLLYRMAKKNDIVSLKSLSADEELKRIGKRIKQLRKKLGYTSYEKFANEHDIHRVQWGRYEQGLDMYSSTLIKIAKLLGVSIKEFFSEGFD